MPGHESNEDIHRSIGYLKLCNFFEYFKVSYSKYVIIVLTLNLSDMFSVSYYVLYFYFTLSLTTPQQKEINLR